MPNLLVGLQNGLRIQVSSCLKAQHSVVVISWGMLFRYPYLQFLFSRLLQKHRKYYGFRLVCGLPNLLSAYARARAARARQMSQYLGACGARARAARVCANKTPCNCNNTNITNNNNNDELTLSSPALPVGALALEYRISRYSCFPTRVKGVWCKKLPV